MNPEDIRRVGRWQVRGLIGKGGFSWVFRVEDENLGQPRALKLLQPGAAQGEGFKRFWREARILAAQDEPNLVRIFELDRDPETGLDYYVMEYMTGQDLSKILKQEGALSAERTLEIFAGALQGLARLHSLRPPILHRDVKPANIQITDEGRVKLFDLGIARVTRAGGGDETVAETELTGFGGFIGTVRYASPEQLQVLDVGPQSDVFSMGLCLFETFEGRHVYESVAEISGSTGTSTTGQGNLYTRVLTYYAMLDANRGGLKLRFRHTPKPVQAVIARALAIRPQDRYPDAGAMRDALLAARAGQVASADLAAVRASSGIRRKWIPFAAAGSLLVAVAGGGIWWAMQGPGSAVDTGPGVVPPGAGTPPVAPTPPVATTEQTARRQGVEELRISIEAAQAAGSLDAKQAAEFREHLGAADAAWSASRFDEADRSYRAAHSVGAQILASVKPTGQPPVAAPDTVAEPAEKAHRERDAAVAAGAATLAAPDFDRAASAITAAETAQKEGRWDAAIAAYQRAAEAFVAATAAAKRVTADAESAQTRAGKARQLLPDGGKCAGLQPAEAAAGCQKGSAAFEKGDAALAAKDVAAARQHYLDAEAEFRRTATLVKATAPPTLTLQPSRPIELEVGAETTILATATDPEGERASIEYVVRDPKGGTTRSKGESLRFAPKRPGKYKIDVTARDPQGGVTTKSMTATVLGEPPAPPSLSVAPAGPIDMELGASTRLVASAEDPEGAAVAVEYTVRDPKGKVSTRKGTVYAFAPTVAGDYTIEVVARDADGDRVKKTVVASVRSAQKEVAPPPSEPAPTPTTASGAGGAGPESAVYEYANALRNCDFQALSAVLRQQFPAMRTLCDQYGSLKLSVRPINQSVKGETAQLRFAQSIRVIGADGGEKVLGSSEMSAELIRRSEGWQIVTLKPVK